MSLTEKAIALMGGSDVLGRSVKGGAELIEAVREGLPVAAVERLINSGQISLSELDRVVIPRKTLEHRRKLGTLAPEQSDRLVRVARMLADAQETFGSDDKAHAWLRRPTSALGGHRPIDLLDTDEGARAVETLLGRIAHGIAA